MKSMKLAFLIGRIFFTITQSLVKRNKALKERIDELEGMLWPDRKTFKDAEKKRKESK